MRPDMHKVIVERPRTGGRGNKGDRKFGRELHREKLDLESAPTKERMKRWGDDKALNENLAPLRKFFLKNVGRPWNKVRSEMSKTLRPTSAVQAHVLQHAKDYVEEHPIMIDGVPHTTGSIYGGLRPLFNTRRKMFKALYVCPRSGLLKVAKAPKVKKPKHPLPRAKRVDALTCAVMMKGCWHEATMHNVFAVLYGNPVSDAVLGQIYSTEQLASFYGKSQGVVQYAAKLRPMTRDEIRRLPF